MKTLTKLVVILLCLSSQAFAERQPTQTVIGTTYMVDPAFEPVLNEMIERLRGIIQEQRDQGKLVGFVSIPLSSRGGGDRGINEEISEHIKQELEKRFGQKHFWALAPGLIESSIPAVNGLHASGGEYMYMWTEVLAGPKGLGEQFDLIYFSGPDDFGKYFGLTGEGDLDKLDAFAAQRASRNQEFAQALSSPERRRAFLRYYSMKASVNFSDGSHDEWNIFRGINERRRKELGIGEQIPVFFNGRQVPGAVMESPAAKGYEVE